MLMMKMLTMVLMMMMMSHDVDDEGVVNGVDDVDDDGAGEGPPNGGVHRVRGGGQRRGSGSPVHLLQRHYTAP